MPAHRGDGLGVEAARASAQLHDGAQPCGVDPFPRRDRLGGYFEGDVSKSNKFRDELVSNPGAIDKDGNVWPLDKPGLGLEVNEEFLRKHPAIEGPGYI